MSVMNECNEPNIMNGDELYVRASLQARLKGDLSGVNKNILQADKVSLFGPWAPIKCESPLKDKKVNIAISVAALVITYGTPGTLRRGEMDTSTHNHPPPTSPPFPLSHFSAPPMY